jgi:hypothetical protein
MIEEISSDKKGGGSLGLKGKKNGRRRRRRKEPEEISIISKSLQNISCENRDDFS